MRFLLDTHTFLWFILNDNRLSNTAKSLIENPKNHRFLSVASIWEMAIKHSKGKLMFHQPFKTFIPHHLQINGIGLLDIEFTHAMAVHNLPYHHRDPFDRLLIAQAMTEQLPIVTADATFGEYDVRQLW